MVDAGPSFVLICLPDRLGCENTSDKLPHTSEYDRSLGA